MCVLISTLVTSSHGQLKNPEVVKKPDSSAIKPFSKDSDWTGTWKGLVAGQLEIVFHLQAPVKAGDKGLAILMFRCKRLKGLL